MMFLANPVLAAEQRHLLIDKNQRWQGTVELDRPVLVAVDARLEIAPGARINVTAKKVVLKVEGELEALGSVAQPIRFEAPHGWFGIELQTTENSRFEHVQIEGAESGIAASQSRFEVRNSLFSSCKTAIKLDRQSESEIAQNEFVDNQTGIDIGTRSQGVVKENLFKGNAVAVVASHNSTGIVRENRFIANQQGVYVQHLFPGTMNENSFEQNKTAVICDQTMASPLITDNRFVGNEKGIVNLLASKPQVRNNLFHDNDIALVNNQLGSPVVEKNLFVGNRLAIKSERRSAPQIEYNRFLENDLALFCDYLSYPTVKQNNFITNNMAVKLGDHQSADMEKQGAADKQTEKILAASGRQGKPAVFHPASGIVDVSLNWWEPDVEEEIEKFFFDRSQEKWVLDDATGKRYLRDEISFRPRLTKPVTDAGRKYQ